MCVYVCVSTVLARRRYVSVCTCVFLLCWLGEGGCGCEYVCVYVCVSTSVG